MVFGQNECVHRVLRSILSQKRNKRSGKSSRRRFDFVEKFGIFDFFNNFLVIWPESESVVQGMGYNMVIIWFR